MNKKDFKAYYDSYWKNKKDKSEEEFQNIINKWLKYRNKIIEGTLTAEDYNAKNELFDGDDCSLRQFLEHESTDFFGTLGTMVSDGLVLWVTDDDEGNQVTKYNRVAITTTEEKSEKEKIINDFLRDVIQKYEWNELLDYLDTSEVFNLYEYPSFIFEIVFLNSILNDNELTQEEQDAHRHYDYQNSLVQIYKYDEIIELDCFKAVERARHVNNKLDSFVKSKKLFEICKNITGIDDAEIDRNTVCLFEGAVWECSHYSNKFVDVIDNNKNIIFYGAPGTGKTFSVKKAIASLGGSDNTVFVQFHPTFSYEDFIEGIKPLGIDASGMLQVGPVNGIFKDLCIKARDNPNVQYYFVADEINRANLSAVFGETLSLIEDDYRYLQSKTIEENKKQGRVVSTALSKLLETMANNGKDVKDLAFAKDGAGNVLFGVPSNIHFIGMMNDADKSIDSFDLALRRRFVWVLMSYDEQVLLNILFDKGISKENIDKYLIACKKLNYYITGVKQDPKDKIDLGKDVKPLGLGRQFEIGHAIYKNILDFKYGKRFLDDAYSKFFDRYLSSTLMEYMRTYSSETELIDNIKMAKKIFIE